MIKQLSISGFRGFANEQRILFSLPNGEVGSGLNVIVGANNSGKSTIIESIKAFNGECSFSEGKRNIITGQRVKIEILDEHDETQSLRTVSSGGSQVEYTNWYYKLGAYILPSRRFVDYEFGNGLWSRQDYITSGVLQNRTYGLNNFYLRLFSMLEKKSVIDPLFERIVGTHVDWTIEQRDNGNYYVKFNFSGLSHSSEGVGDGLWSILTICDALYDSNENSIIVIDEPELSLHPAFQRRVMKEFLEYSRNHQIIICTHSPYFVSWEAIKNGGALIRTQKLLDGSIEVKSLSDQTKASINGLLKDLNNPHILGLNAAEVFFLEDYIIVTEGQEDVICFNRELDAQGLQINGNFYGWGAGGASKEMQILNILQDLGYKKVVAIFDSDESVKADEVRKTFPQYEAIVLPKEDVRDKQKIRKEGIVDVKGIFESKGKLKVEYIDWFRNDFVKVINDYFAS